MKASNVNRRNRTAGIGRIGLVLLIAMGMVVTSLPVAGGQQAGKQEKGKNDSDKSVGFVLGKDVTAEDVGLPWYPGARKVQDTSDESSAVRMGLWGGFKLLVLKLESSDSPGKIATFYRKELAKYGQVLDCSQPPAKAEKPAGSQANALDCDADQPPEGGFILKAGKKDKQHVVGVKPDGTGSKIALIYIENPQS